jgi:hypothetical protein
MLQRVAVHIEDICGDVNPCPLPNGECSSGVRPGFPQGLKPGISRQATTYRESQDRISHLSVAFDAQYYCGAMTYVDKGGFALWEPDYRDVLAISTRRDADCDLANPLSLFGIHAVLDVCCCRSNGKQISCKRSWEKLRSTARQRRGAAHGTRSLRACRLHLRVRPLPPPFRPDAAPPGWRRGSRRGSAAPR